MAPIGTERLTNVDWDKLRIFDVVAAAGSFTHAGETLGMSQSAVSRQIASLEADFGVSLFHRHARGLILTEQGELLARTVHDMRSRLDEAKTRLIDSKDRPNGELRVTTTVGLGSNWLVPNLDEFFDLYPEINLRVVLADDELDISMREADVAIRLREPVQPDLVRRRLFDVHLHAYVSPTYIARHQQPRSLHELDAHRIVTFGRDAPGYLQQMNWLETAGLEAGAAPRVPVLRVNNITALKRAVTRGIGIAVLPDYTVDANARLVPVFAEHDLPCFECYFVYPEEMRNVARVNAFRDYLVARARRWSH